MRYKTPMFGGDLRKSEDRQWLKSLLGKVVPLDERLIAKRLYQLGEQEFGLKIIVNLMLQSKDPNRRVHLEVCKNAVEDLGYFRDERAIDALISMLDEFPDAASFSLAQIGGSRLKKDLHRLSIEHSLRGFGAVLALGYLRDPMVIGTLMDFIMFPKKKAEFIGQVSLEKAQSYLSTELLRALGGYDSPKAETLFVEAVTMGDIRVFLGEYVRKEFIGAGWEEEITILGWRIVRKFGWNELITPDQVKRLGTPERDFNDHALRGEFVEIVGKVWQDVLKRREL